MRGRATLTTVPSMKAIPDPRTVAASTHRPRGSPKASPVSVSDEHSNHGPTQQHAGEVLPPLLRSRSMTPATAGYSGTPLPRKLGIRDGHRVLLAGAPAGFDLGDLPSVDLHDVDVQRRAGATPYDVILAFTPDQRTLDRTVPRARPPAGQQRRPVDRLAQAVERRAHRPRREHRARRRPRRRPGRQQGVRGRRDVVGPAVRRAAARTADEPLRPFAVAQRREPRPQHRRRRPGMRMSASAQEPTAKRRERRPRDLVSAE